MRWFGFLLFAIAFSSCSSKNTRMLHVQQINAPQQLDFESISTALEVETASVPIDKLNWNAFTYQPEVSFRIGHSEEMLYLKFYVSEAHILAQHSQPNTATHRDSCVEFFIDPDQSGGYYNFEFNCIGTTHLAYGPNRQKRSFVDPDQILDQVFTASTLGTTPFEEKSGAFQWEMVVALPASLFVHHPDLNFKALQSKANFYKCGDDTSLPHYLSWNEINSPKPDFHRPEFFGSLLFE